MRRAINEWETHVSMPQAMLYYPVEKEKFPYRCPPILIFARLPKGKCDAKNQQTFNTLASTWHKCATRKWIPLAASSEMEMRMRVRMRMALQDAVSRAQLLISCQTKEGRRVPVPPPVNSPMSANTYINCATSSGRTILSPGPATPIRSTRLSLSLSLTLSLCFYSPSSAIWIAFEREII